MMPAIRLAVSAMPGFKDEGVSKQATTLIQKAARKVESQRPRIYPTAVRRMCRPKRRIRRGGGLRRLNHPFWGRKKGGSPPEFTLNAVKGGLLQSRPPKRAENENFLFGCR
jgi:hypothetical protein